MQVYAEANVLETIKREFSYAFKKDKYPGVPRIELNTIENKAFKIERQSIIPIRGLHHKLPVLGYRINNMAYITDMNFISEKEMKKIKDLDLLIINALRIEKHISHFNLDEALEVIAKCNPKMAYLTHLSHAIGKYDDLLKTLPKNVKIGFDGLSLEI